MTRTALAALALLAAAGPAAATDPAVGQGPVTADRGVSLFAETCLAGRPDFGDVDETLSKLGFSEPDLSGMRYHAEEAIAAMAATADELPAPAPPTCMVALPSVPEPDAEARLAPLLESAITQGLEAHRDDSIDLPHRVWTWPEGSVTAKLVCSDDGRGGSSLVLYVPRAEGGS